MRSNVLAALMAGFALVTCACHRGPKQPRNVLLVSIDTVRADRIGCYGREGASTPRLDALAEHGCRFADASTPYPLTLPAHVSLMTGQDPLRHGVRHNGLFALPASATTLAERLEARGFRTGGFVASVVLARRQGIAQGFQTWTEPGAKDAAALFLLAERPATEVNRDALAFVARADPRPWFAWVHYMEPHYPYKPPEPEASRFKEDPYQGEIAAADRALGELLDGLKAKGQLEGTLVVVVSDHGEDLGDHAEGTHGIFLYQSTLHVPLVVGGAGVRGGKVIPEPVGLVDVVPTVLNALGPDSKADAAGAVDGRSLWGAIAGGDELEAGRKLYAETFLPRFDYGWSELRALRLGQDKYVLAPRPELYHLDADPAEASDRAASDTALAASLRQALLADVDAREGAGGPAERVELSPSDREALQSLGYLGTGADGAARATAAADAAGARPDPKDRVGDAVTLDKANYLMRHGQSAEGEALLDTLIAAQPRFMEARISLLVAKLMQGKIDEAEGVARNLEDASKAEPEAARVAARAHLLLADVRVRQGRLQDAATEFEAAMATPQPVEIHVTLAKVYVNIGRPLDAERTLDEVVARGEGTPEVTALLADLAARR